MRFLKRFSLGSLSPQYAYSLLRLMLLSIGLQATLSGWAAQPPRPQTALPQAVLHIGPYALKTQVANTPQTREKGLMFRQHLPANEGMLFVFEEPAIQCFWMKNTPVPLTAAFIADNGQVVGMADMQPYSEEEHCSAQAVRFVLEVNQGWFSYLPLQPPITIKGLPVVD
jgi:uncharacterized membrane protein (UPF0127 family)